MSSNDTTPTESSSGSPSLQSTPPVLEYGFPKPQGDIDIEEALQRKPLRWTFQGQVQANKSRPLAAAPEDVRKMDLERAKQDLLRMQGAIGNDAKSGSKRTPN
ncbi:hypothetical protein C2857_005625 [Epichloe festucae Fl1]|uniref:Uncharacterized protein n=1 Tax=Epichloe festucae (strain Fl1) TaxID=877507 RepID=A0A7S9KSX3_EPIFF|nr:hypothetical protein C2857_005625 [Epichloe festucae Fl1]